MANIELKLNKNLFSPTLYPLLLDYSHRFEFYKGSARLRQELFRDIETNSEGIK